jgi:hypothetical protein
MATISTIEKASFGKEDKLEEAFIAKPISFSPSLTPIINLS